MRMRYKCLIKLYKSIPKRIIIIIPKVLNLIFKKIGNTLSKLNRYDEAIL